MDAGRATLDVLRSSVMKQLQALDADGDGELSIEELEAAAEHWVDWVEIRVRKFMVFVNTQPYKALLLSTVGFVACFHGKNFT